MTSLMQADIFFFISSIGFVILGTLAAILIVLCIRLSMSCMRIVHKVESSMDTIGDVTMDLIEELRENVFFRMFFHPKKKARTTKAKVHLTE